jgi:hypothetical protein
MLTPCDAANFSNANLLLRVSSDEVDCEHTCILKALVEYPQGNLEEIQEKTLRST